MNEERWLRYRHRKIPAIEYEVLEDSSTPNGEFAAKVYAFKDDLCLRIRSIRNLAFAEEVHEPAFTMMPAGLFFDVYQRGEG